MFVDLKDGLTHRQKEIEMDNSLFYINFDPNEEQREFIDNIKVTTADSIDPIYVLRKPVIEKKMDYDYDDGFAVLIPKHKIMFIGFGNDEDLFDEYVDDFIEDVGGIVKKYDFISLIGRARKWRNEYTVKISEEERKKNSFAQILEKNQLPDAEMIRKGEILITLAVGSINDAKRLGEDVPENILDHIKRKIILFDGEQTKFIFDEPRKKRITIQGLAGTGKTELLLHKIKELYISSDENKIVFTCHNEILADSLRKRVPEFFDFMKVEEQIKWNERLWVMRSWGSEKDYNSGVYSYICNYYNIPFRRYSYNTTFDEVCTIVLEKINQIENFECCFDYILIDESQDFSESFFQLCEKVAKQCVYVAGDIFQDIFKSQLLSIVNPDFLLNKCYRTDPRTLMGAHAIGMGLFEKKLRWLKDEEWESCGYEIKRTNTKVELHRKPLKRIEDVELKNGIEVVQVSQESYIKQVLLILEKIKEENPTVTPDDIGIMFLENVKDNYNLASSLQTIVKEELGWDVNIGYETRERRKGTLFISNRNNVKGLEFPFVICIMRRTLTNDFQRRNSIYMMLTRSFLTSYFLIPAENQNIDGILKGIDFVNEKGFLNIDEPSEEEKEELYNAIINRTNVHKSQYDLVEEILDELDIKGEERKRLHKLVETSYKEEVDETKLSTIIQINYELMGKA